MIIQCGSHPLRGGALAARRERMAVALPSVLEGGAFDFSSILSLGPIFHILIGCRSLIPGP